MAKSALFFFKNKPCEKVNKSIGAYYCAFKVTQCAKPLHTKAVPKNIRSKGAKWWL